MQGKFEFAFPQTGVDVLHFWRPRAAVPDHYGSTAVLSLGNDTLKPTIFRRMIFDSHCQPLDGRIEGRAFRYRPGEQDAVPLQAEVVVQTASLMLLDDEGKSRSTTLLRCAAFGFRRNLEIS